METIRLQQALDNVSPIEATGYYCICCFLDTPTFKTLVSLLDLLDQEIKIDNSMTSSQKTCFQYLFRDWAYQFIHHRITDAQTQQIFTLNKHFQDPNHLLTAIDHLKKDPKHNLVLIRFCLSLLYHSHQQSEIINSKIDALTILLNKTTPKEKIVITDATNHTAKYLWMSYHFIMILYLIYYLFNPMPFL